MFVNNKIFILGLGKSGYEAAKFLAKRGNDVTLNDGGDKSKLDSSKLEELEGLGIKLILGSHPDDAFDDSFDYLIKNPGVPIDHKYVLKAHELDIEVINEMEMAYRLLPEGVKIIGITGTNGKTTTTTLTYNIMKRAFGDRVFLAGNIGFPLISILEKVKSGDIIVIEVSCQQLENLSQFKPDVGVMTNLSVAHTDFLKSYENYKRVKTKLFQNQTENDVAILNIENNDVMKQTENIKSQSKYFSSKKEINGAYLKGSDLYYYDDLIISRDDIFVVGLHNVENILAAIMVVKEFNVSNDIICEELKEFRGVTHRLEYVSSINDRKFYNDSEATNIKSTQIALSSFKQPIILILGGLERGQNFDDLIDFSDNVKLIVGIGQCRDRVVDFAKKINIPVLSFEHLSDSFSKLYEMSSAGDVVLLSPAAASWDQYPNAETRGDEFKNLVYDLEQKIK